MTARPCRSLLAGAGIAALTLVPMAGVAAADSRPATQDDAAQTAGPGDDAQVTEGPGEPEDEQPTEEPTQEEPTEEEPTQEEPGEEPTEEEPTEEEPVDEEPVDLPGDGWDDLLDPYDPQLWADWLAEEGFTGVTCTADDTGYEVYELTQEAPEGTDWLLAVLFSEVSEEETWLDLFVEPWVGDQMWLEGDDGQPLPLDLVILCAADIEASPADPGHIDTDPVVHHPQPVPATPVAGGDSGSGDESGSGSAPGPVVETDVPAADTGAGALTGLAATVTAAGALVLGRRRWARH